LERVMGKHPQVNEVAAIAIQPVVSTSSMHKSIINTHWIA
jgi:hypothetical protein